MGKGDVDSYDWDEMRAEDVHRTVVKSLFVLLDFVSVLDCSCDALDKRNKVDKIPTEFLAIGDLEKVEGFGLLRQSAPAHQVSVSENEG